MKFSQRLIIGFLCAQGSACTQFPGISDSGCGNHVIEEGSEDCDGFSDPKVKGSVCMHPGTAFECHYDCSIGSNGKQTPCPIGWGCDAEFVCRAPTGVFTESSRSPDVGAWTLSAGDFDGDGREDVVSAEPLDASGATLLRFNYFDVQGALSGTPRLFPKTLLSPTFNRISNGDAISDVAFTVGSIGVMKGRADRNWVPEVFSSYRRSNATVRIIGVHDSAIEGSTSFTTLITSVDDGNGFYLGDDNGILDKRVDVPGSIKELAGDLVSGDVFQDPKHSPCLEPVFAMRGSTHFSVVDTCDTAESGQVIWRKSFVLTEIELVPPAPIDAAPQLVDMNQDGHLDVLLGAGGKPYVAYGDGQALAGATPYTYPDPNAFPSGTPLAVGHFTADKALDFVFPDRLLGSSTAYDGAVPRYAQVRNRQTSPWTVAKIGDFNGNGLADVVAASSGSLRIDFFNGIGDGYLSASQILTSAPVQFLTAGDFDADRTTDLAFAEVSPVDAVNGTLKVAFGNPFQLPGLPVVVGRVQGLEALNSFRDSGRDNLTACSSETIAGQQNGALTLLAGGPDRVPFAPLALTEFSSNQSVENANAFAVVSGHFVSSEKTGILALALFQPRGEGPPPVNVWSVPAIIEPGSASVRLPGALDRRLKPIVYNGEDGSVYADIAATAADLDNDGLDEGIFAMPTADRQCGLLLIGVDEHGALGRASQEPIIISEQCEDPQILPVKFSDTDPPHLALLTGTSGAEGRKLFLLSNDGHGQFSSQNIVQISAQGDSPQAFTVISLANAETAIAYITKGALRIMRASGGFREPEDVPGGVIVNNGTGIVAADVNGDHLSDLVFSESGQLRVLKAGLKVP